MTDRMIDALIAEKLMGWTNVRVGIPPNDGFSSADDVVGNSPSSAFNRVPRFSTDPYASKMVREKLAERFAYSLSYIHSLQGRGYFRFRLMDSATTTLHETEADTEERAVAKAALLAFGVKPTPSPQ